MGIALSTSWNAFRYSEGTAVIDEIRKLGFEAVELSFNLTPAMVEDIRNLSVAGEIKISSTHNFCPIPEGIERKLALPDFYSMSSLDEVQRQLAIKQTKISIDTAVKLNAKAVVLHCGRVEMPDQTRALIALYQKGAKDTLEYTHLKDQMQKDREELIKPFLENTLKSLSEISSYAQKQNICLGIENRFYYREIPSFDEIGIILSEFSDTNVFYWHDTGHAQVFENLGFISHHKNYLDAYADRIYGWHLHNVVGCQDHNSPSKGDMDFNLFAPYIKKNQLKVIEAHYPATTDEIMSGLKYLQRVFNE